ncbi:MAG TPA: hypothetical protein VGN05_09610 [Parvibaculum sp.]|jgi:hypothetical protein
MCKILGVFAVFLGLAACGPFMETRYDFKPPATKSGMQCVSNCQSDQSQCLEHGRRQKEMCRKDADRQIERDYQKAKDNYIVALKLFAKDPSKFPEPKEPSRGYPSYYQCDQMGSECVPQYQMCYRSCGGEIREYQVCTANCDQK